MKIFLLIVLTLLINTCESEKNSEAASGIRGYDSATVPTIANDASLQPVVDATQNTTNTGVDTGSDGAPSVQSDSGLPATLDSSQTVTDSSSMSADAADVGPANNDVTDSSEGATAEKDASSPVTPLDAGSRTPVFKKTSCIDPNVVSADSEANFPCEGVDMWISLPAQCITRVCGLIFNIHGGGMLDRTWMEDATNMVALGKTNDYVVVHPHKGTWSVSTDKSVVFTLMEQAIEAFDVDRKRIHATGYSQGGQISWALACEHADIIASVAPTEEINRVSNCWKSPTLPAREIPVLFAYGKQDNIGGGYAAAQQAVNDFVNSYSMTGPETIAGTEGTSYHRQRWTSVIGNVLEFITHDYRNSFLAGHCLPLEGGTTLVNCSEPVDYNWGEETVAFFKAHPMP